MVCLTALESVSKEIPCLCTSPHPADINFILHGSTPESGSGSHIRGCAKCAATVIGAVRETPLGIPPIMSAMTAAIAAGGHVFSLPKTFARMGIDPQFYKRTLARALKKLRDPIAQLLLAILERKCEEFIAFLETCTPEQRLQIYVSFDAMWDRPVIGRHCHATAIVIGMPGGPRLIAAEFVYRSTYSDQNATRCGPGGVAGVSGKALEPEAVAALIRALHSAGIHDIPICSADGDSTTQADLKAAFPGTVVSPCQNHAYLGIKELIQLWIPKRDTQKYQRSATNLGSQAASVMPDSVEDAEARLERAIAAVATRVPKSGASARGAALAEGGGAAMGIGAAAAKKSAAKGGGAAMGIVATHGPSEPSSLT